MKSRKTYTIYFFSNARGETKKITLPASLIKTASILGFVFILFFTAIAVDYAGLLFEYNESKWLQAENVRLKNQFKVVENRLITLEKGAERVRNYWQKLKLITEVGGPDKELSLAMGPGARTPSNSMEISQRQTASLLPRSRGLFLSSPVTDAARGELSVEGMRDYASLVVRLDRATQESELREQGLIELWQRLSERESLVSAMPSVKPSNGWVTSKFGYRVSPFTGGRILHRGLDIAGPTGTPIVAPADGVVSFSGYDAGYGKLLSIDHGYGLVTRYGHNSQLYVKVGQRVRRGDVIAAVGSTGRSTGPHLHYEVRLNGLAVNPQKYILNE